MQQLEKTVINTFGNKGKDWLDNLPNILKKLCKQWQLKNIVPVMNMSYHYVAKAIDKNDAPVILKFGCDEKSIKNEYFALQHFAGCGSVKIIDVNFRDNALLLEQADPGITLKDAKLNFSDKISIYASTLKLIAKSPIPKNTSIYMGDWLKVIDQINDARVDSKYIKKAKTLKNNLLSSVKSEYFCHGDLHFENVIKNGDAWLAIDPKGIVGDMSFEAACFDLMPADELKAINGDVQVVIYARIKLLAKELDINLEILTGWIYLRIILSAQWFIEDGGDPGHMINMADYLYPLLKN